MTKITVGIAAVAVLAMAGIAEARTPQAGQSRATATDGSDATCQPVLQRLNTMIQNMAASQRRVERELADVKSATGDQRITALTDVVTELVQQRREALERMQAVDWSQVAQMMQATAGGTVACQVLTPFPIDSPGRH